MLRETRRCRLRRVFCTAAAALAFALPLGGCSSATGTSSGPLNLFSAANAQDEVLKQRAAADKFPTAQQAGIAPAKSD